MAQKNKTRTGGKSAKAVATSAKRKTATVAAAKSASVKSSASGSSRVASKKAETKKPVTKAKAKAATAAKVAKPAAAKKPEVAKPAKAAAPVAKPFTAASVRGVMRRGAAPAARAVAAAKPAGQKLSAPVATPATPKEIAEKTAANRELASQKKPVNQRHGFKANEFIVYPAHGVGRIVGIEEQEIAGMSLELFVITFEKEKLTLRVPTGKLASVGMRKLAEDQTVKKAMEILKGRARVKRTMWSRRAQEYVAKINSGDLVSIAEVVRDLYRSDAQPEQSYSERQLYEDALDRMAREIAAVEKLDERGAVQRITDVLSKSARGRRAAEGSENEEVKAA
jgi:CarD family transcriptional regulator